MTSRVHDLGTFLRQAPSDHAPEALRGARDDHDPAVVAAALGLDRIGQCLHAASPRKRLALPDRTSAWSAADNPSLSTAVTGSVSSMVKG